MGILGKDVSNLRIFDFSLRLFLIPFSVASIWIAVTNKQDNIDFGKLEFNTFIGLKYLVFISALSAGYALFSALSSFIKCIGAKAWFFFVSDQIIAYLLVTSMAALWEFLYLAYYGDQVVTWSRACDSYGKFCSKLRLVLVLHCITVLCFLILAVISAYRVFTTFHPPFLPSKEPQQETTTSATT